MVILQNCDGSNYAVSGKIITTFAYFQGHFWSHLSCKHWSFLPILVHYLLLQIYHTVNRLRSFLSHGRLVTQSLGRSVTWSHGHTVTRSHGHTVTRSLGHMVTWSLGHSVTRSLGHLVTWSLGHLVTWSLGHLVT